MKEMQQHDSDELKLRLIDVWHGFKKSVISNAVHEWRRRLCVLAMKKRKFSACNLTPYATP